MEIEKKFLIKDIPENLEQYERKEIQQGYLSIKDPVLRVRKSNYDYFITYKSRIVIPEDKEEVALRSKEVELVISKDAYYHLLKKADYNVIEKTRYLIPLDNNLIAELDVFHKQLEGLIVIEVEFLDEKTAENFIPPSWFAEDVTFDDRFKNNYLVKINSFNDETVIRH